MSSYKYSKLNWNAFFDYKNKHKGNTAVICGTGKTLLDYIPINNAIHIGCNSCVFWDKLILDYYFFNDYLWSSGELKQAIKEYRPKIQKFLGTFIGDFNFGCPQNFAIESDALWYDSEGPFWGSQKGSFQTDIQKYHFGDAGGSTIFICMQFALFCGFQEINIVGCDINGSQHFHQNNRKSDLSYLKRSWGLFKSFIDNNYPNVQINVINPIGLKGYFNDIYQ